MSIYGKKYPWLRLRNLYTGKLFGNGYDAMDDLPEGWRKAFGSMMCEELDAVIKTADLKDTIIFDQVKEKFGSLRIYYSPYNCEIDEIIKKYEVLSQNICIHCGKPDVPIIDTGWVRPSCRECYHKVSNRIYYSYDLLSEGKESRMRDTYQVTKHKWISEENGFAVSEVTEHDIHETAEKIREEYTRRIKKPDFTEHTGESEWN